MEPSREAVIARMRKLLRGLERRRRVRHAIVGVADIGGEWSWADAAGEASPGVAMRAETPWFLASVTKLYIAVSVLRLAERGLVELEAPISAHLPGELARGLHVLDGVDRSELITPAHLLGHMSGLPDWLDDRPRRGRSLSDEMVEVEDRALSLEQAVAHARDELRPHFPPSDPAAAKPRIRYSDTNFQLLMLIAERVARRPIEEIHRELIFEPLGLSRTWLPGLPAPPGAGEPAAVWFGDRLLSARPLAMRSFRDLYATLEDLLRFGRALFGGELFERPETLELMRGRFNRFGFPRGAAGFRAPSWPIEYGLGLMRFEVSRPLAAGLRLPGLVGHTGATGSWLWHCPDLGLLIAGTVDQASAATVPFRPVPRALAGIG